MSDMGLLARHPCMTPETLYQYAFHLFMSATGDGTDDPLGPTLRAKLSTRLITLAFDHKPRSGTAQSYALAVAHYLAHPSRKAAQWCEDNA